MGERIEYVTTDDGCVLWTVRSGDSGGSASAASAAADLGARADRAASAAAASAPSADLGATADPAASAAAGSADPAASAAPAPAAPASAASPAESAGSASPSPAASAAGPTHGFVLCHGGPGFWDTLGPIAHVLEDFGPVVRWDQRGGGRSRWRPPYSVARFVADLDRVREHHGFSEVTLLGHSFGATLALRYALEPAYAGRVRRLVYVAGVGLGFAWRDEHWARARLAGEPYAERRTALLALRERTVAQERELSLLKLAAEFPDPARARELAATQVAELFDEDEVYAPIDAEMRGWSEKESVERCRALAVPTLILDGARDLRPRWSVDSLAQALPRCTRVELPDAGHFPWLDQPDAFAAQLRAFINT